MDIICLLDINKFKVTVLGALMKFLQGETQKFLDNCYKTQITSYMDMIYFYSSKYIRP